MMQVDLGELAEHLVRQVRPLSRVSRSNCSMMLRGLACIASLTGSITQSNRRSTVDDSTTLPYSDCS